MAAYAELELVDFATQALHWGLHESVAPAAFTAIVAQLDQPAWPAIDWDQPVGASPAPYDAAFWALTYQAEYAGMMAAGQLVACLPWPQAKHAAALQARDEARHVALFRRLALRFGSDTIPNPALHRLAGVALLDSSWRLKVLGNYVLERAALHAFGDAQRTVSDPVALAVLAQVRQDEARHVAFGGLLLEQPGPLGTLVGQLHHTYAPVLLQLGFDPEVVRHAVRHQDRRLRRAMEVTRDG